MRVALATVGTMGDVLPFVLLARELATRGHEVTAITWPVHATAFDLPGVRVEPAGPHADPERIAAVAAEAASRGPMDQVAVLRDFHLADGEAHERRLRELLPGHDLVVLHGIHALAHAAALDENLPWVTAVFDPVLLPTATGPPPGMPNLGPLNRALWWMLDRALARTSRPLDGVLERSGNAQRGLPLFRARSPRLHLIGCSPGIMRIPTDLPPNTRITGAWLDHDAPSPLPDGVEAFLADGAPPIVMTFGSMHGIDATVLDAAIEGILESGRRVILQGRTEVTSPGLLSIGAVDHRSLFPRAALVVHHGGAGTTNAACAAGVPSLVVPHVGDQRYWADRLHRLGVAPAPQPVSKLTADGLVSAALAAASDHDMHGRARALGQRVRAEDGVTTAADAIEGVAPAG
ncbi:MAG TPA: glycosyltransferase [Candidatus Limnocylindria bacterium]|nr:glycosyltransferase [Candidatus Limnocylindria bacterium]